MESLRDWYKGGDRDKHVPKYIVGLFGGVAGKEIHTHTNFRGVTVGSIDSLMCVCTHRDNIKSKIKH